MYKYDQPHFISLNHTTLKFAYLILFGLFYSIDLVNKMFYNDI